MNILYFVIILIPGRLDAMHDDASIYYSEISILCAQNHPTVWF